MSTGNIKEIMFLGSKARRVRGADNFTAIYEPTSSGASNQGPSESENCIEVANAHDAEENSDDTCHVDRDLARDPILERYYPGSAISCDRILLTEFLEMRACV
jgi:hypothetical protein